MPICTTASLKGPDVKALERVESLGCEFIL